MCSYYYQYHDYGYCRCVQDETLCGGSGIRCYHKLGRKSFEDDLWETGVAGKFKVIINMLKERR